MEYIKGKFKKLIYESSGGSGYKVGLFRVKEASDNLKEELENHTVTFTGYFYDLRTTFVKILIFCDSSWRSVKGNVDCIVYIHPYTLCVIFFLL